MMKKGIKISAGILLVITIIFVFKLIGPAVHKPGDGYFYIKTGTTIGQVQQQLLDEKLLKNLTWFHVAEKFLSYDVVKPGRYKIPSGMSILTLLRILRNGRQSPVEFVITRLRTKEQFASRLGKSFEFDSLTAIQFLNNNDSLKKYGLDSNTIMAAALPLTYEIKWNTTPRAVFDKFFDAYKNFWTDNRKQLAQQKGLSVDQVITLASIVDEETNAEKEKGNIASVYMNRISKGMMLQADPTVKFALKDFAIKRIFNKHLVVESPYNTYRNKGLPPGPICTPQETTIDAVLNAPKTDYIYFVASPAFDGTHIFSTNYEEHQKHAKAYQAALNQKFGAITDSAQ